MCPVLASVALCLCACSQNGETVALRRPPIREVGPAFDLSRQQEKIRGRLALILTIIFGILVLLPLVFWFVLVDLKGLDINTWLQTALPAVTALLGSAMGFYFGTRST